MSKFHGDIDGSYYYYYAVLLTHFIDILSVETICNADRRLNYRPSFADVFCVLSVLR